MEHVDQQAYSPRRHYRNRRHRCELGSSIPGEGAGSRGYRYRAGCRGRAEALHRRGLAGARKAWPFTRRITIKTDLLGRPTDGDKGRRPGPGKWTREDRFQEEAIWAAR